MSRTPLGNRGITEATRLFDAIDTSQFTLPDLAEKLGERLGRRVTTNQVKHQLDAMGLTHLRTRAASAPGGSRVRYLAAQVFRALAEIHDIGVRSEELERIRVRVQCLANGQGIEKCEQAGQRIDAAVEANLFKEQQ